MSFVAHDVGVAATRFARAMSHAVADALIDTGLSSSEYGVLDHIQRNPGIITAELARYLQMTPQALGRLTRQLIDRGLVATTVGGPGRRQPITPTAAGQHLYEQVRPLIEAALEQLLAGLESSERTSLLQMLLGVSDMADANRPSSGHEQP